MRIGIDARSLSYRLTGIGIYLKHLLEEIQRKDHTNHYYLLSNTLINFELKNPKWFKIEGKFKRKFLSTLWMQFRVPLIVYRYNMDLFWGPRHNLPLFLPSRVKTVLTVHDLVHRFYPETMALPNLFIERMLMRWSLLRSDRIIADSQSTASDIKSLYRVCQNKINTIHPGVPVLPDNSNDDVNLTKNFPSKYFLFVGTLDPRKNLERLFRAFELITPHNHGVYLMIVGATGWKNKGFHRIIETHRLKDYVRFSGYVSRDELVAYYKKALCLLFPSLYEGFGFPILEAMSCGTPVITSNTASMPEVSGDAALLVDPYNIKDLAKAMYNVMNNENLRKYLAIKGLERVKAFSWKHCAEETIQVLETIFKR